MDAPSPLLRFHSFRRGLLLFAAVGSLAAPCWAQALLGRGTEGLYLLQHGSAAEVRIGFEAAAEKTFELELPTGATMPDLVGLENGGWVLAAIDPVGPGLLVFEDGKGVPQSLPSPITRDPWLERPRLLARDGLEGMIWLEGTERERLAVRAALFDGKTWAEPVTVSSPGPGSQLALAAVPLAAGGALAVWSAFDGEDDEILWSAYNGSTWSPPQRLHGDNPRPDVTPELLAQGNGALAAWSAYRNGHYRVRIARFDGTHWSPPRTIGPAGSLFPTFAGGRQPRLLYRRAVPRAWEAAEIDSSGQPLRRVRLETMDTQRPLLRQEEEEIYFLWPDRAPVPAAWTSP